MGTQPKCVHTPMTTNLRDDDRGNETWQCDAMRTATPGR